MYLFIKAPFHGNIAAAKKGIKERRVFETRCEEIELIPVLFFGTLEPSIDEST